MQKILTIHAGIKKSQLPILFFANKSDIPGSISSVEVVQTLALDAITDRPWHISYASLSSLFSFSPSSYFSLSLLLTFAL